MKLLLWVILFSISSQAREVTFEWEPFEDALGYEVQISKDEEFQNVVSKKRTKKASATLSLKIGSYYYRVRAFDKAKRPGYWSKGQSVKITAYAPELILPEVNREFKYYEIAPKIKFEWKPEKGRAAEKYRVLIQKINGEKVAEEISDLASIEIRKMTQGDFQWRVQSIHGNYTSPYSKPRTFKVVQLPLTPPVLKSPIKAEAVPAYRPAKLHWERDTHTNYADLFLTGQRDIKKQNLPDDVQYTIDYMEPGEYRWTVTTKEGKTTPGVTANAESFEVRPDILSKGNTYISMGLGYSTLNVQDSEIHKYQHGSFTKDFRGRHYITKSTGVGVRMQQYHMSRGPSDVTGNSWMGVVLARFGDTGFTQDFYLGIADRDMVIFNGNNDYFNSRIFGGVFGTNIWATLKKDWKVLFDAHYFKPMDHLEGAYNFEGDHYEVELGASFNFYYQFWLTYRLRWEKTLYYVRPKGTPVNQALTHVESRLEPFHLSLGWEY